MMAGIMSSMRCAAVLMVMAALVLAGCQHDGDGGGSKWFGKQAKSTGATGAKPLAPVKAAKPAKVKTSRGPSAWKPLKLKPSRGPTVVKPMKVQPTRMPTPRKPLVLQPTRVQSTDRKNLFNLTSKKSQPPLGQPPAHQPRNLWQWLAGDPKIDQYPVKQNDSWFRSWFKGSKGK